MRALLAVSLLALAACDGGDPADAADAACELRPLERSRVEACVTGDVEARISGVPSPSGWGDAGVPYNLWSLSSQGSGVTGGVDLYVYLENETVSVEAGAFAVLDGPIPVGAFEKRPPEAPVGTSVVVLYLPTGRGGVEAVAATGGELVIEAAGPDLVEGSFSVVADRGGRRLEAEGRFRYDPSELYRR